MLAIATPVYGDASSASISLGYHRAALELIKAPDVEFLGRASSMFCNTDLVRARSRALYEAWSRGFDHLLFWDADVVGEAGQLAACIRGMLSTGHHLIGAPYPRKVVTWDRIATFVNSQRFGREDAFTVADLQSWAYEPVQHGTGPRVGDCAPCAHVPMGFTMISLELMAKVYEAPVGTFPEFLDLGGKVLRAPFMLTVTGKDGPSPVLLSEDYSFGERMRLAVPGFQPWLYLGPGAPLQHVGSYVFG